MATLLINRLEPGTDSSNRPEVFVEAQIFDDEVGVINYPKWFNGAQAIAIIDDNSIVLSIITPLVPGLISQKRHDMQVELNNPPTTPE